MATKKGNETVLIEYLGRKEKIQLNLNYLERKTISIRKSGSTFYLSEEDAEKLIAENPNAFRRAQDRAECDLCGEVFGTKAWLSRHMNEVHDAAEDGASPEARMSKAVDRFKKAAGAKKAAGESATDDKEDGDE